MERLNRRFDLVTPFLMYVVVDTGGINRVTLNRHRNQ